MLHKGSSLEFGWREERNLSSSGSLHDLKSKSESGRGFRVKAKPAINSASIADTQFQSCDYIETRSAAFIVNDAKDLA